MVPSFRPTGFEIFSKKFSATKYVIIPTRFKIPLRQLKY